MAFDDTGLQPQVKALLALAGAGERLMPLVCSGPADTAAVQLLGRARKIEWFPNALSPVGAMAGLWLYFNCIEQAHSVAQDLDTPEGSYWHGIVHRREPDDGNAGYWMRHVGVHPIHAPLRNKAAEFGLVWTPLSFIDYCSKARREPGSEIERIALELQRAEWQLLFSWCASVRP